MFDSAAECPAYRKDINLIEKVQKRFTKCLRGMYDLSYEERLNQLGKITLENRRHYSDMVFVYKALHGIVDCDANDFGDLYLKNSCTGGENIRLQQGWNELLLDFNYLHFERRPHGISSP